MDFRVLGPLEVAGLGVPAGVKERTLLARLLMDAGAAVPVDALLEAAWPEAPADAATRSLRVRLTALRAFLGPEVLVRAGGGYRLAIESEHVDAQRFERLVRDAAAQPAAAALAGYEAALVLWRGRPYEGLEFAQAEIRRLDDLRTEAEEGRARALIELGRAEEAVPGLRGLVGEQPLSEEPARILARALYGAGRQVEALDALRSLAARLRELGLEPASETHALEQAILRHETALAPHEEHARAPPALPARPTRFFGREADLARAEALVGAGALVTVTGVGGAGKTRLARELAGRAAASFPDGCWWSELAPVSDPDDLPGALADAVGLAPQAASGGVTRIAEYVGKRRALLVLDNCEHLLDGVADAAERLLAGCPHLVVLATSRAALDIDGEQVLRLAGLEAPADGPAVALFIDRARAAGSLVEPAEQLDSVTELCRRLDGLPLAIELAAARTRSFTPADIAGRLRERLGLPGVAGRRAARHSTLEAAIDWSYRLLDHPQRRLFERMSVFHGAAAPAAIAEVCADGELPAKAVPELLDQLVARSLVTAVAGAGLARHGLLQTLREFAAARLRERGEEAALRERHAEQLTARAQRLLAQPAAWTAGLPFADEFEDLRAAVRLHIRGDGDADGVFAALAPLWATAHSRYAQDIAALAEQALARWPAVHPMRPAALGTAAVARLVCGDEPAARAHARAALAIEDLVGVPALVARRALVVLGFYQADPAEALARTRDLAQRARDSGDPWIACEMDGFTVHALDATGDLDGALALAGTMRAEADALGIAHMRTWARYVTGAALLQRDPGAARGWLTECLTLSRRVSHHSIARASLRALAVAALFEGRSDDATERLDEALARDDAADSLQLWATVMAAAALAADRGRPEAAAELFAAADATGPGHPLVHAERMLLGNARRRIEASLSADECARATARGRGHNLAAARSLARKALAAHSAPR